MSKPRRWLAAYAGLLVLSALVAVWREPGPPRSLATETARVRALGGQGEVELAFLARDLAADAPALVLLHGSPGSSADFTGLVREPELEGRALLVPDLPGFGASTRTVPDYSVRAHAQYVLALADRLELEELDLVGFSMGGGVALELTALAPERVRSVSLVASIGVQELELFGRHDLNRLVHGAQLALLRWGPWLVPHFGLWSGEFLGVPYARNFYDTDQRPLRGHLLAWDGPMLIAHGSDDFLVPVEAAREHHRLVPQSELVVDDAGHFQLFLDPAPIAANLGAFLDRVDEGAAARRDRVGSARLAASLQPFDPATVPPLAGPGLLLLLLIIALATLVSEDLTCIGAGLLVAQGRIELVPAAAACFFGIFVGDLMLYLAGRWFGRPALERAPLSWVVKPESVDRAAAWFAQRGGRVVFVSRFVPGLRLPTYVAAGVLRQPFWSFTLYFVLAGLLWTPLFVAIASWLGAETKALLAVFEAWALPILAGLVLGLLAVQRLLVPALTFRGRRMLAGRWMRLTHWEFWPPYVFYVPVVLRVAWLALRHRSLALVTAANPGIPTGGFIGESKSRILRALEGGAGRIAPFRFLRADDEPERRREAAEEFRATLATRLPIVLKPDVGQRGSGVRILREEAELARALDELAVDSVLQEFEPGLEFGVFWTHRPSEPEGRIFSITSKVLPELVGDGEHTLEELILLDRRAVAQADVYLAANTARLLEVPAAGERVRLVDLGTHCRGAIFLDGAELATEELRAAVQETSAAFEGFHFGRYDLIARSEEAFQRGEFRVIELNGLTSEATHVYDPKTSLREAYRVLFRQWELAFEIARECRDRGHRPCRLRDLVRETLAYRRLARGHRPRRSVEASPTRELAQ